MADSPDFDDLRSILDAAVRAGETRPTLDALLAVVYNHPDWRWVQEQCLTLLDHPEHDVRALAVVCLGHVATFHGTIDAERVRTRLNALAAAEPDLAGKVEDALGDIEVTESPPAPEPEWVPLHDDWFDALIAAEFRRAGFTADSDAAWPLAHIVDECVWSVQLEKGFDPRRWVIRVGASFPEGPTPLRLRRAAPDRSYTFETPAWFFSSDFSPGIELGVPPEAAFNQDGFETSHDAALDLDSDVTVAERCRRIREVAEQVGGVADTVRTLEKLRAFLLSFGDNYFFHISYDAKPWFDPQGKHFSDPYTSIVGSAT